MALTFPPESVEAVVFDMGGVFFLPDHRRVARALQDVGVEVPGDSEPYHRAHYAGIRDYDRSENPPETWDAYLIGYLNELGIDGDELVVATATARRVWSISAHELWTWRQEEATNGLRSLAALGLGLAVVSNCDGTAARCLSQARVCQVGDGTGVSVTTIVDSGDIGVEKPDPAIFAPAIEALGIPAEQCIYVGDAVRNDVHGSGAAGMWPVHLDPYDLHPDATHDRIASVAELVAHLEEARRG